MSFRLFIYYCAVCGGIAAFFGWAFGRFAVMDSRLAQAGVRGLLLGMLIALALSILDVLGSGAGKGFRGAGRVAVAVFLGCFGGLFGGIVGQALYGWTQLSLFLVLGWAITGLLIGLSIGTFELLLGFAEQSDTHGARRKLLNGMLGGAIGGTLGGMLFALTLTVAWNLFGEQADRFWLPSVTGFVALGVCIGLMIGLCQVILKEAWLKVEKGFRPGREVLLSRPQITIGRGEMCDVALFGDASVEKIHARIERQGKDYYLIDLQTSGGTWVNDRRIEESRRLESGDVIRVGKATVRFSERQRAAPGT